MILKKKKRSKSNIIKFLLLDIRSFVEDLNPSLLSTIDEEFEKAAKRTPPTPSRVQGVSFIISY